MIAYVFVDRLADPYRIIKSKEATGCPKFEVSSDEEEEGGEDDDDDDDVDDTH